MSTEATVNAHIEAVVTRIRSRIAEEPTPAPSPAQLRDLRYQRNVTRALAAKVPVGEDVFPFVVGDAQDTEAVRVVALAVREWEAGRGKGTRRGRILLLSAGAGRGKTIGICRGPVVESESHFVYVDARTLADLGRDAMTRLRELEIVAIDELGWSRASDERACDLMLQRYDDGLLTVGAGIVSPATSQGLLTDPMLSRMERQARRGWDWLFPSDGGAAWGELNGPDMRTEVKR